MSSFSRQEGDCLVECHYWLSAEAVALALALFERFERKAGERYAADLARELAEAGFFPKTLSPLGRSQRIRRLLDSEPRIDGHVLRVVTEPRRGLYQKTKKVVCELATFAAPAAPPHGRQGGGAPATYSSAYYPPALAAAADTQLAEMVRKHETWLSHPSGPGWDQNSPLQRGLNQKLVDECRALHVRLGALERLLAEKGIKPAPLAED